MGSTGGAILTKDLIRLKLADEIRVSILPIILGDGLLFFDQIGQEQALHLKDTTAYKNGMVELCSSRQKETHAGNMGLPQVGVQW